MLKLKKLLWKQYFRVRWLFWYLFCLHHEDDNGIGTWFYHVGIPLISCSSWHIEGALGMSAIVCNAQWNAHSYQNPHNFGSYNTEYWNRKNYTSLSLDRGANKIDIRYQSKTNFQYRLFKRNVLELSMGWGGPIWSTSSVVIGSSLGSLKCVLCSRDTQRSEARLTPEKAKAGSVCRMQGTSLALSSSSRACQGKWCVSVFLRTDVGPSMTTEIQKQEDGCQDQFTKSWGRGHKWPLGIQMHLPGSRYLYMKSIQWWVLPRAQKITPQDNESCFNIGQVKRQHSQWNSTWSTRSSPLSLVHLLSKLWPWKGPKQLVLGEVEKLKRRLRRCQNHHPVPLQISSPKQAYIWGRGRFNIELVLEFWLIYWTR